jgi:hypothetical protein
MKKIFSAFLLTLIAVSIGFAQVVKITPKKTVYTRKGRDVPKEKKTFVVTYPLISGVMPLTTKKKLENTISYWRVFETTLQENQGEYHWLGELSYAVNYNKNGVLDIALTQEGVGAYPDGSTVNVLVDLKTGEQVKFRDAFKTDSLADFAKIVNVKLEAEKKEIVQQINRGAFSDSGGKEADDALKEQINELNFTAETFDQFTISDQGLTIIYDAGFPHVIKAAQPDGLYFFTWNEVKPFIRRDGLLAKFIS